MDFKYVYKICTKEEWEEAKKNGKFEGSKKDKEDGFIHFSNESQLKGTLEKFFFKQKNLLLLKLNALKLNNLIYEQASDGNMFPHLYEPFKISHVISEYKIETSEKGFHKLPSKLT